MKPSALAVFQMQSIGFLYSSPRIRPFGNRSVGSEDAKRRHEGSQRCLPVSAKSGRPTVVDSRERGVGGLKEESMVSACERWIGQ